MQNKICIILDIKGRILLPGSEVGEFTAKPTPNKYQEG